MKENSHSYPITSYVITTSHTRLLLRLKFRTPPNANFPSRVEQQNSRVSCNKQVNAATWLGFSSHIHVIRNTQATASRMHFQEALLLHLLKIVFPQLTEIPWCSATFLVRTICRGGRGDQSAHITTAGVLCGDGAVDLEDFRCLTSKHVSMSKKCRLCLFSWKSPEHRGNTEGPSQVLWIHQVLTKITNFSKPYFIFYRPIKPLLNTFIDWIQTVFVQPWVWITCLTTWEEF